jgi:hypothetical protein
MVSDTFLGSLTGFHRQPCTVVEHSEKTHRAPTSRLLAPGSFRVACDPPDELADPPFCGDYDDLDSGIGFNIVLSIAGVCHRSRREIDIVTHDPGAPRSRSRKAAIAEIRSFNSFLPLPSV